MPYVTMITRLVLLNYPSITQLWWGIHPCIGFWSTNKTFGEVVASRKEAGSKWPFYRLWVNSGNHCVMTIFYLHCMCPTGEGSEIQNFNVNPFNSFSFNSTIKRLEIVSNISFCKYL